MTSVKLTQTMKGLLKMNGIEVPFSSCPGYMRNFIKLSVTKTERKTTLIDSSNKVH